MNEDWRSVALQENPFLAEAARAQSSPFWTPQKGAEALTGHARGAAVEWESQWLLDAGLDWLIEQTRYFAHSEGRAEHAGLVVLRLLLIATAHLDTTQKKVLKDWLSYARGVLTAEKVQRRLARLAQQQGYGVARNARFLKPVVVMGFEGYPSSLECYKLSTAEVLFLCYGVLEDYIVRLYVDLNREDRGDFDFYLSNIHAIFHLYRKTHADQKFFAEFLSLIDDENYTSLKRDNGEVLVIKKMINHSFYDNAVEDGKHKAFIRLYPGLKFPQDLNTLNEERAAAVQKLARWYAAKSYMNDHYGDLHLSLWNEIFGSFEMVEGDKDRKDRIAIIEERLNVLHRWACLSAIKKRLLVPYPEQATGTVLDCMNW